MLKTAILFGDGMVIQREKAVTVWGTAEPGAPVEVTLQGASAQCRADANGDWRVVCGPFHTSLCEEMRIRSGGEEICIRDIAVGEVWLAGGQSNMEFPMQYDAELESQKAHCDGRIRFFDYPEVAYEGQLDEADYSRQYGFWRICSPDQLKWFSAVAYYFADLLCRRYDVPVGIIGCNWGGTPACAWMSQEAIVSCGGKAWIDDYHAAVSALNVEEYCSKFKAHPTNYKVDLLSDTLTDILLKGYHTETILEKAAAAGIPDEDLVLVMGPYSERRPAGLYDTMLRPVAPYAVRGVIWYQGEADEEKAYLYHRIFPALIRCWRELWAEELPFLFVQIAPFADWMGCKGVRYPEVRAAQQWTADHVANTAMAVITDAGCSWDIHPKHKRPAGERLALLAQRYVYGEDVLCEAPRLREISVTDTQIVLSFDFAGEGLRLRGGKFDSLEIYQAGYPIAYSECKAAGNTVTVSGDAIRAGAPTEVRIAWTDYHEVNLTNSAGIPARPAMVSLNIPGKEQRAE